MNAFKRERELFTPKMDTIIWVQFYIMWMNNVPFPVLTATLSRIKMWMYSYRTLTHTHTHPIELLNVVVFIFNTYKMLIKNVLFKLQPYLVCKCNSVWSAIREIEIERGELSALALSLSSLCPYSSFRRLPFCGASWLDELIDGEVRYFKLSCRFPFYSCKMVRSKSNLNQSINLYKKCERRTNFLTQDQFLNQLD